MNSRVLKPELQANVSEQQQQNQATVSVKLEARRTNPRQNVPRARPGNQPPHQAAEAQDRCSDGTWGTGRFPESNPALVEDWWSWFWDH